jgi:hypothetical protein
MTASQYGKVCIAGNMLGKRPSQAIELMTDMFLEKRYPGHLAASQSMAQAKAEKKELEENAIVGIPFIDKLIFKNQDRIAEWIVSAMQSDSPKKREFAQALDTYLGLGISLPGTDLVANNPADQSHTGG